MYSLLVVDDEKDVAKSIAYDINWEELDITEVQCVYNGLEALEYMNKRRVDVVLTDIRMPGMDGIRLAEKIADRWKYVKMIFMTGYEEFEYARQALRYGVTEYLLKPAANEELFDAVKKGLDKLRAELKQAAEKESVQAQWERARPLLKEKLLQQWIMRRESSGCIRMSRCTSCWERSIWSLLQRSSLPFSRSGLSLATRKRSRRSEERRVGKEC